MDSESSTAAKPSRGRGVIWLIWFLILVIFIGYPLSAGPVLGMYYKRQTPGWVYSLYAPLNYVCENVPAVGAFYRWYMPLWQN